tara:strand:+ start:105 stop:1010 length:906 start_codon:yes stop_codon:yes gene_type:complete
MGYLKTLLSKDVIVTPFRVNKQFSHSGTPVDYNDNGVFVLTGSNDTYITGEGTGSAALVYNSIKQLYYSNYQLPNNGNPSLVATASFNPDGTITGPRYTPNYINNIQSLDEKRYFPTESGFGISVLSIPSKQFGESIKPSSFTIENVGVISHKDDGQGNLIDQVSEEIDGNIIYEAGLVIFTGAEGVGLDPDNTFFSFPNPKWESTVTIYETQYKCTIRANEFNYSLNPSLLSSSIRGQNKILESGSAQYADFVTGSDFSPYVTTVGLYDDDQNLLAVAKLAQPLATSQTTDTTILINIDR